MKYLLERYLKSLLKKWSKTLTSLENPPFPLFKKVEQNINTFRKGGAKIIYILLNIDNFYNK